MNKRTAEGLLTAAIAEHARIHRQIMRNEYKSKSKAGEAIRRYEYLTKKISEYKTALENIKNDQSKTY